MEHLKIKNIIHYAYWIIETEKHFQLLYYNNNTNGDILYSDNNNINEIHNSKTNLIQKII